MTQVISLVGPSKATMTPAPSSSPSPSPSVIEVNGPEPSRAYRTGVSTPDSPSLRTAILAKKRAASINTADASYARLERLTVNTPNTMNSDDSRDMICLCTPAPKIPRPRNGELIYILTFVILAIPFFTIKTITTTTPKTVKTTTPTTTRLFRHHRGQTLLTSLISNFNMSTCHTYILNVTSVTNILSSSIHFIPPASPVLSRRQKPQHIQLRHLQNHRGTVERRR